MNPTSEFFLIAPGGWEGSTNSEEIEARVWQRLTLRQDGGDWAYLNFTSDTSIWDQQNGECMLYIGFTEHPDRRIAELQVNFAQSMTAGSKELETLLRELEAEFSLQRDHVL